IGGGQKPPVHLLPLGVFVASCHDVARARTGGVTVLEHASRLTSMAPTRRRVLAGAAASLPLLGGAARAAGEPIQIGWVGPLSPPGGYAEGTNMKNAAEIAAIE